MALAGRRTTVVPLVFTLPPPPPVTPCWSRLPARAAWTRLGQVACNDSVGSVRMAETHAVDGLRSAAETRPRSTLGIQRFNDQMNARWEYFGRGSIRKLSPYVPFFLLRFGQNPTMKNLNAKRNSSMKTTLGNRGFQDRGECVTWRRNVGANNLQVEGSIITLCHVQCIFMLYMVCIIM